MSRAVDKVIAANALSVASETTLVAGAMGRRVRLISMTVTSSVSGNLVFRDGVAGTVVAVAPCLAGAPTVVDMAEGICTTRGNALTVQGPGASTMSGTVLLALE